MMAGSNWDSGYPGEAFLTQSNVWREARTVDNKQIMVYFQISGKTLRVKAPSMTSSGYPARAKFVVVYK